LREISTTHCPSFIFLSETKNQKNYLETLRIRNNLTNSFYVDPVGRSGGLCIWWNDDDIQINVIDSRRNSITAWISTQSDKNPFLTTFVYAQSTKEGRKPMWEHFNDASKQINSPWLLVGDLNVYGNPDDKEGRIEASQVKIEEYNSFLANTQFLDLGFSGSKFTWRVLFKDGSKISERLDRALGNQELLSNFPNIRIHDETFRGSDHCPLTILFDDQKRFPRSPFRFIAEWAHKEETQSIIKKAWKSPKKSGYQTEKMQISSDKLEEKESLLDRQRNCALK
jgi:exonuclease III